MHRTRPVLLFVLLISFCPFQLHPQEVKPDSTSKKAKKQEGLPLKPERKVEIDTSEGTWMALDVSPDGKTVVFELPGHLYTIPFEGGDAKPAWRFLRTWDRTA